MWKSPIFTLKANKIAKKIYSDIGIVNDGELSYNVVCRIELECVISNQERGSEDVY